MNEIKLKTMSNILEVAISQIGVEEDAAHTNHGDAIKYQNAAGLPAGGGFPWCQSFVYWCGLQAYGEANPIPRTGGVMDCWNKAPVSAKIERSGSSAYNIPAGSQFILNLGKGLGHTGIVESIDPDGTIHTIEGNSNPAGGRDGYCVARHIRRLTDNVLEGFICYDYPTS
jgi:hypothetical protein